MAVSLPALMERYRQWLQEEVRIDEWSLDMPSVLATKIGDKYYPANTAALLPPTEITFEETNSGLVCTATIRFEIKYLYSKKFTYDELPHVLTTGILNNIYYEGILGKAAIHPDILSVSTPDIGVETLVSQREPNTGSDWIVALRPAFRVTFKVGKANVDGIQPGDEENPILIKNLQVAIFRAEPEFKVEDESTYILDTVMNFPREES